jgi:hypothetical protein
MVGKCGRCGVKEYPSKEEQVQDWPEHRKYCNGGLEQTKKSQKIKYLCSPGFRPMVDFAIDLVNVITSPEILHLFGPYLLHEQWLIGPGETTLQGVAMEWGKKLLSLEKYDTKFTTPSLVMKHLDHNIPFPKNALCIGLSPYALEEVKMGTKFALPDNRPNGMTIMDYWAWYCSNKCDLFVISFLMMLALLRKIRYYQYKGKYVKHWGMINLYYTPKNFTPICKIYEWNIDGKRSKSDTITREFYDKDISVDACSYRVIVLNLEDNSKVYIDYSCAQFKAGLGDNIDSTNLIHKNLADQASNHIPVLVCESEEELTEFGYIKTPDNQITLLKTVDNFTDIISKKHPREENMFIILIKQLLETTLTLLPKKPTQLELTKLKLTDTIHLPIWKKMEDEKKKIDGDLRKN